MTGCVIIIEVRAICERHALLTVPQIKIGARSDIQIGRDQAGVLLTMTSADHVQNQITLSPLIVCD